MYLINVSGLMNLLDNVVQTRTVTHVYNYKIYYDCQSCLFTILKKGIVETPFIHINRLTRHCDKAIV